MGDNFPAVLGCYNKNANHSATKAIDVKHKWAWQEIKKGNVITGHLCRERMIADAGTKQEAYPNWKKMTDVWLGNKFIPEMIGLKLGMKPAPLRPYRINTCEKENDPTLEYFLACERHNIDTKLPDEIKQLFNTPIDKDDEFVANLNADG